MNHTPKKPWCSRTGERSVVDAGYFEQVCRPLRTYTAIIIHNLNLRDCVGYTRPISPSKTVREIISLFGLEEPIVGKIALS